MKCQKKKKYAPTFSNEYILKMKVQKNKSFYIIQFLNQ